jgi:hypothetical protein
MQSNWECVACVCVSLGLKIRGKLFRGSALLRCCRLRPLLYRKSTWCAVWHTSATDISHQGVLWWYHRQPHTEICSRNWLQRFTGLLSGLSFVTVDGNINNTVKTDFIDRDGSYIILIPDGNIKSFKAQISGLIKGISKIFKFVEFRNTACCCWSKWILNIANWNISFFHKT